MNNRKQLNRHDFFGSCSPGRDIYPGQTTFSVGIFKWIAKASGVGLKKSAVIHRVKGSVSYPEKVYGKADEICDMLDKGKSLTGLSTMV